MPQAKSIIFLIISLSLVHDLFSQSLPANYTKISELVEKGESQTAITQLEALKKDQPRIFSANNYDYLIARLYEQEGDVANAATNYSAAVKRESVLKAYALWHLSQIMRNSGNLLMERLYLQELSLISGGNLINTAAQKRLAHSNFTSGNYDVAIKLLSTRRIAANDRKRNGSDDDQDVDPPREDLILIGKSYLQKNRVEDARKIFNQLVNDLPNPKRPDDFALGGAIELDKLELGTENLGDSAPKLKDEEHLKRADIYRFNRNFPLAIIHYQAIVKDHPESNQVAVSMFQIGRAFGQEREYQKAIEWFEKLLSRFPENRLSASALYQAASAYANLDQTLEAVKRYEKYIADNPKARNLERAYLNIIDAFRDGGDNKQALLWAARTQEKFRDERGEAVALFSEIRIHISQENWRKALNRLNALKEMKNLGGISIAGGTNDDEVAFLRGFTAEKLGRFDEAIDVYLSIPDGLKKYYGWRATERLRSLKADVKTTEVIEQKFKRLSATASQTLTSSNADEIRNAAQNAIRISVGEETKSELLARISRANALLEEYKNAPRRQLSVFGRKTILREPIKAFSENRHQTLADELLFLGLYDEATPELETSLRKGLSNNTGSLSDFPHETAYTLAVYYKRGYIADRAIAYTESIWRKIPGDYSLELIPREQIELLFPKPYVPSLVKYGKEKKVDPRFILSIMRQESRFQANVKSAAAARGLMQFISTTSNKMAREMKIGNFVQDDLYDPPTAIRFGSHYVANIFSDFPNQPPAVAASYNGGEDRMMRWFNRSKTDDPDRYVPEIIFSQTKDYAYKVMANYRIYKMIYDENLRDIGKPDSSNASIK